MNGADAPVLAAIAPEVAHSGFAAHLSDVETALIEIGAALERADSEAVEAHTAALQAALHATLRNPPTGVMPAALRRRLIAINGRIAGQREALARVHAAGERAAQVLVPGAAAIYGRDGRVPQRLRLGAARA